MELIYVDNDIVVCVKPARVLSTDEPGGVPELVRQALGDSKADVRTVHRLDRVVSGLMVLARNAAAASELSRQIREDCFQKEYLAVLHGTPEEDSGRLEDLLLRDKARRMTFVTDQMAKGVQPASLRFRVLNRQNGMSRVQIQLETGRTHQIRVHLSHKNHPLLGDLVYGAEKHPQNVRFAKYTEGQCLHAKELILTHPRTGETMRFTSELPSYFTEILDILRKTM